MSPATLSLEKRKSKHNFCQTHEKTPTHQKIAKYLEEIHNVKVPKNFHLNLVSEHYEFRASSFDMSLSLVDSIVEACEYWRDYVVDWDALVCDEVLSMARIHTSVIWLRSFEQKGIELKKIPSYYLETVVTSTGTIRVYNR